jgi:hypothetical protein
MIQLKESRLGQSVVTVEDAMLVKFDQCNPRQEHLFGLAFLNEVHEVELACKWIPLINCGVASSACLTSNEAGRVAKPVSHHDAAAYATLESR